MDWHALEKMKVTELREMAKEKTSLQGVSGISKEHLVEELAKVLGIHKPHKVAVGQQKTDLKKRIQMAKKTRDEVAGKDPAQLATVRHELHRLKRQLRRHSQLTSS